jgi:GNAT superfamily N-acetyltransferase
MGSTERPKAAASRRPSPAGIKESGEATFPCEPIHPLGTSDLASALRLSESAHWNQTEADWRCMLTLGQGWAIHAFDATGAAQLAASTVVLPYGTGFAWISMVLVLPEFQRRGYATRLLRHALAQLAARGMAAILDATPAGHAVYLQEGFRDTWGFARYRRERRDGTEAARAMPASAPGPTTRPLRESDWPAIAALDAPAFGADRQPLLRALAARLPAAARVVEEQGSLRGFVFGRDGREASQIGPLLADDAATARSLIGDVLSALPGPVFVDLLHSRQALLPWLQQQGFNLQRPFTRMVHGAPSAPGDNAAIVLVAGPELG